MTEWHHLSIDKTEKECKTSIDTGLSEKEAKRRLIKCGKNQLAHKKNKSIFQKFLEQFKDFMIITLICAALISFLVSYANGEFDLIDPFIILFIVVVNAILGVAQETKAERSLEALKKLSAPNAFVKRDGLIQTVPSEDLVPGDLIILETGQLVPADARLTEAVNLKTEESSLTGESHPIDKEAGCILPEETPFGDRRNLVLSGSIVCYGRGTAIVTKTGMQTEVGHIAKLIMEDEAPQTPLQKRLAGTGKVLGIASLVICIVIFIVGIYNERPIFSMFMTAVSLAVAAIPEGLPAIVTIMLSLGVQRMAKKNAVIRKLPAVETLGSATVICSDKTGTLTQNKMTVTNIASIHGKEERNGPYAEFLFSLGALCNDSHIQMEKKPRGHGKQINILGEPTENALVSAASECNISKNKLDLQYKRVGEIPFDSVRKCMTTIHKIEDGYRVITKGATEMILPKCSMYYDNGKSLLMLPTHQRTIYTHNDNFTKNALRVIAISFRDYSTYPKLTDSQLENNLVFVGLVGMIDPPREEVKEAVMTCKRAGIKPVMITGDHVATACAIARDLGILTSHDKAVTGQELSQMTDTELENTINQYSVFARVSPNHKVKIVKAFQRQGNIVAMTGDGVNDAPALKAADIGCAMGKSGTDVAKNASDMILTDDNFATIVSAVREGRGIYDNIKKAIHFLLSCNIGEIMTIFVAIMLGLPSPLFPVQLLWINLVTDSFPAVALGMEAPDKNIMKRPPISPDKGMFADGLMGRIVIEGMLIGSLALLAYVTGVKIAPDQAAATGTTMCFAVLGLSQLFHSFNMRSEHSLLEKGIFGNKKLVLSFLLCAFLQISVLTIDPLPEIFSAVTLNMKQWIIVLILAFLPIPIVELEKMMKMKE